MWVLLFWSKVRMFLLKWWGGFLGMGFGGYKRGLGLEKSFVDTL